MNQRHRIEFSSATLELACHINLAFPNLVTIKLVVTAMQIVWCIITASACMGLYISQNSLHTPEDAQLSQAVNQGVSQMSPNMSWVALLFSFFWGQQVCQAGGHDHDHHVDHNHDHDHTRRGCVTTSVVEQV